MFVDIWSAYAICYAIGYMLFVRPWMKNFKYRKTVDVVFYISLLVFSTINYLN